MANAYNYSNTAVQTTLGGNISNSATSFTVAATTGFPASTPYVLALDYGGASEELVVVTGVAGTTLTVTRGFSGTSAQSHSIGAVVRHVYNAQDATDFRTHEGATSDVHGVTGALVGATQAQTLTNKTLTTPTINGAALSATFTGNPTFSGTVTASGTLTSSGGSLTGTWGGTPTFTGGPIFTTLSALHTRAATTDPAIRVRLDADAQSRLIIQADGTQVWGTGAATGDTNLYRSAARTLKTDNTFVAVGNIAAIPTDTSLDGLDVNLPTGTVGDLLNLRVNSSIQAAMGADGTFRNYGGNTPSTYTPTWTGIGTATFSTNTGFYWKLGKMVYVCVYAVASAAGSGSTTVTVTMPSNVDRTLRQALTVHCEVIGVGGSATKTTRGGECVFFTSGSGATADRIRVDDSDGDGENNVQGSDIGATTIISIQGWYREA